MLLYSKKHDLTSTRCCSQACIVVMYGAKEASARLTWLDPNYFTEKIDSIGKAIPGVTIKVLGPDGQETGVGEEGQIVGYGPNIM